MGIVEKFEHDVKDIGGKVIYVSPLVKDNRKDSIWYRGTIAIFEYDGKVFNIFASGHSSIAFNANGKEYFYNNDDGARCVYDDTEIEKVLKDDETLHSLNVEWFYNNWFEYEIVDKKTGIVVAASSADDTSTDAEEALDIASLIEIN